MESGHTTAPYAYGYSTILSNTSYGTAQANKSLASKSLGGASADPALASWYEQANAYYQAVMSGAEPQPDPAAWNEFLSQMSWAYQQMGASGAPGAWGDPTTGGAPGYGPQPGLASDPYGGMPGAMGTYVHTEEEARVGFTGNATRDFWSNDINLDIAPLSATVTAERTTDTRSTPAEEVIKVTITDPATGTEAVYFIHDYADATIKINVPEASQVTDLTGGLIDIGNFRQNGGSASNEVDVSFEEQDNGEFLVEVPYGQSVNFTPEGGEDQTWDVYANFNISVKPSDIVRVSQDGEGGYLITVTHKDETSDTFKIHPGFTGNINGYPENVEWGNPAEGGGIGEEIPSVFRGDITLNSTGPSASTNPSTPPDETNGNEATYNTQQNVEMYADYDDQVDTHRITAPGEVIIHGASYADTARVTKIGDQYRIKVYRNGITDRNDPNYSMEIYYVDGASKITLDLLPEKIDGTAANDPIIVKGSGDYADTANAGDMAIAESLASMIGNDVKAEDIYTTASDMGIDLSLPPANLEDGRFYEFLVTIDPVLSNLLQGYKTGDRTERESLRTQIRDRLVSLLQILYPNTEISAASGGGSNKDNINFGGQEVDFLIDGADAHSVDNLWDILQFN